MPIYVEFELGKKISYPNLTFFLGLKKSIALTLTLIIPMFFTQQYMILILCQNFGGEKIDFFALHFLLYVGTGMRAVCTFCTGFKNQKNSWRYPSNPKV